MSNQWPLAALGYLLIFMLIQALIIGPALWLELVTQILFG